LLFFWLFGSEKRLFDLYFGFFENFSVICDPNVVFLANFWIFLIENGYLG